MQPFTYLIDVDTPMQQESDKHCQQDQR